VGVKDRKESSGGAVGVDIWHTRSTRREFDATKKRKRQKRYPKGVS